MSARVAAAGKERFAARRVYPSLLLEVPLLLLVAREAPTISENRHRRDQSESCGGIRRSTVAVNRSSHPDVPRNGQDLGCKGLRKASVRHLRLAYSPSVELKSADQHCAFTHMVVRPVISAPRAPSPRFPALLAIVFGKKSQSLVSLSECGVPKLIRQDRLLNGAARIWKPASSPLQTGTIRRSCTTRLSLSASLLGGGN